MHSIRLHSVRFGDAETRSLSRMEMRFTQLWGTTRQRHLLRVKGGC